MTRPNIKHPAPKGKNMLKQVDHNRVFCEQQECHYRTNASARLRCQGLESRIFWFGGTSQYKKRQKSNIDPSECRDGNPFDWIYKLSLLIGFFFRGIGEEEKMGEVVVVGSVAVVACVVPFDKSILIGWF